MNGSDLNSLSNPAVNIASSLAPHTSWPRAGRADASPLAIPGGTGSGPNITSADFLTLLVSELKNQDPTQPTDPNAYVQQLVGVNSLQQLIQINQGLAAIEKKPPIPV